MLRHPATVPGFRCALLAGLALAMGGAAHAVEDEAGFRRVVLPFLETHCTACHGEKKQKGDFRIDTLPRDFRDEGIARHWAEMMDRMDSGDMPPKKEPRPAGAEIAQVADWITTRLVEAEAARQASEGERISYRRLSREEYRATMRDLLGVTCDVADPAGLPTEPDWQGFERIGSVLTISPSHVEKYLATADAALEECLATGPRPPVKTVRWTPRDHRVRGDLADLLSARGTFERTRIDLVPNNGALDSEQLHIDDAGDYLVRIRFSALRPPGGRAPRLRVYAADLNRVLFEQDVEAAEDQPTTIAFRAHLPVGVHLIRLVNAVPGPNPEDRPSRPLNSKPLVRLQRRLPWQLKLTGDDGVPIQPVIMLDWVEWQGPVQESWPPPTHQRIFFRGDGAPGDLAYAREILTRFVARAYRRPARSEDLARLLPLVERQLTAGATFVAALRTGLLAALSSKDFLYLVEGASAPGAARLNDFELASRLSYFLWSSLPDERLMQLAAQGALHRPEVLGEEARRMLADPRAAAFADAFPRQWLHLRQVGQFAPDRKLYPDYDDYLESSMVAESTSFFAEVLHHDLGLREFLDSDWTMLNGRLAEHYGVPGVEGEAMRRVALRPQDHRGGLLTQGAILSMTSDGTRHRPVHRGKWVLSNVLGKPPPPPPANVPPLGTTAANQAKLSLREKLALHRADGTCASCHRKIDPLGLAFEHYDAIGRWRTTEAVRDGQGQDPAIDASGELPDGRAFADEAGLKHLLVDDLDRCGAAFTEKLATYALRRGMTIADRALLADLAARSKAHGWRLADLIRLLVTSELFQER